MFYGVLYPTALVGEARETHNYSSDISPTGEYQEKLVEEATINEIILMKLLDKFKIDAEEPSEVQESNLTVIDYDDY